MFERRAGIEPRVCFAIQERANAPTLGGAVFPLHYRAREARPVSKKRARSSDNAPRLVFLTLRIAWWPCYRNANYTLKAWQT